MNMLPKRKLDGKIVNLIGQEFGYLTVVHSLPSLNNMAQWACACKCGNRKDVRGQYLIKGITRSCGCMTKELARLSKSRNPNRKPPVARSRSMLGMTRAEKHLEPVEVPFRHDMTTREHWINTFKRMRETGTGKRDLIPLMDEVGVKWEEVA